MSSFLSLSVKWFGNSKHENRMKNAESNIQEPSLCPSFSNQIIRRVKLLGSCDWRRIKNRQKTSMEEESIDYVPQAKFCKTEQSGTFSILIYMLV